MEKVNLLQASPDDLYLSPKSVFERIVLSAAKALYKVDLLKNNVITSFDSYNYYFHANCLFLPLHLVCKVSIEGTAKRLAEMILNSSESAKDNLSIQTDLTKSMELWRYLQTEALRPVRLAATRIMMHVIDVLAETHNDVAASTARSLWINHVLEPTLFLDSVPLIRVEILSHIHFYLERNPEIFGFNDCVYFLAVSLDDTHTSVQLAAARQIRHIAAHWRRNNCNETREKSKKHITERSVTMGTSDGGTELHLGSEDVEFASEMWIHRLKNISKESGDKSLRAIAQRCLVLMSKNPIPKAPRKYIKKCKSRQEVMAEQLQVLQVKY